MVTEFTLQSSNNISTSTQNYTLTINNLLTGDVVVLVHHLIPFDLNSLNALPYLATNESNTYLSISSLAIKDMNGNDVVEINDTEALRVNLFMNDNTRPALLSYDLNMNTGQLILTFTETVNTSLLDVTEILLLNMEVNETQLYNLTTNSSTDSEDWPIIVVNIGLVDLNEIKRMNSLAISNETTYLTLSVYTIRDAFNNMNLPTIGMGVNVFTEDTTPPELESFDLNLSTDIITLRFSETVNAASFDPPSLTLLEQRIEEDYNITTVVNYTLSGGDNLPLTTDSTSLMLELNLEDRNTLRSIVELAVSNETTYISITPYLVQDMNANNITEVNSSFALKVLSFIPDMVEPILERFDLDMDGPTLTLYFSETVNASTLDVSGITLQSSSSFENASQYYSLTSHPYLEGSRTVSDNEPRIVIDLGLVDSNRIKFLRDLAQDEESTFLTLTNFTIEDMYGNQVVAISDENATRVYNYLRDSTGPMLQAFSLNLTSERLILTFDETVDFSSIIASLITIQNDNTLMSYHRLMIVSPIGPDSHVLSLNLTATQMDLNALKLDTSLAVSAGSTYIHIEAGALYDLNRYPLANPVQENISIATSYYPDLTSPEVTSFEVNLNASLLTFYFNEVVNVFTLDPTAVRLQNTEFEYESEYTLTGGSTESVNGLVLVLKMTRYDVNEIKQIEDLLVSQNTSFLTITNDFIMDMNDNPVVQIVQSDALEANDFVTDSTMPRLLWFDLDMNRGLLSLYFDETVDIMSVNYNCITLQTDPSGFIQHTLTGGTVLMPERVFEYSGSGSGSGSGIFNASSRVMINSPMFGNSLLDEFSVFFDTQAMIDETVVIVNFTLDDLNSLKSLHIGETNLTSWLMIESCVIRDQAGETAVPVVNAQNVRRYMEDVSSPQLQQFDLDMNTGMLTLRFSETVVGYLLNVSQITLQSNMDLLPENHHTLSLDTIGSPSGFEPVVIVHIQPLDLNEIKRLTMLATSTETTYISITMHLIRDTKENYVVPIPVSEPLQVTIYTADQNRPALVYYSLDLDSDILSLTFNETVAGNTFDDYQIVLQDYIVSFPFDSFYQLRNSLFDTFESTVINVYLSFHDVNVIKNMTRLATRQRNTYLSFSALLVNDTNSNQVIPISNGSATLADVFVEDLKRPELTGFSLNLTNEILTLSFSETVNIATMNLEEITLQNDKMGSIYRKLTGGTIISGNGPFVDVILNKNDLNFIKQFRQFCTSENNTFISYTHDLVEDMNGNDLIGLEFTNGSQVDEFYEDLVNPELVSFDLDLTEEILYLSYSETVDPYTINISSLTLQQQQSSLPDSVVESYTLTIANVSTMYSTLIEVFLDTSDLDHIKELFNLATDRDDTYISFPMASILDMNYNEVVAINPENATQVSRYTMDTISPVLHGWSLDLKNDLIILHFTETVNVQSLNPVSLTIQSVNTSSVASETLSGGSMSQRNFTSVEVYLTTTDINNIKRNTDIATSLSNTYVSITADLISDMSENPVVAIPSLAALEVQNITFDDNAPVLEYFNIDMNLGILTLKFNETVNTSSLVLEYITLQSEANVSDIEDFELEVLTLTGGETVTTDEPILNVTFTIDDFNALKRQELCSTPYDCFIAFPEDLVLDMSINRIIEIVNSSAMLVNVYIDDTTHPVLNNFVQFDLNVGTLILQFSETVAVSSIMYPSITLQSFFRNAQARLSLQEGNVTSINDTFLMITLNPDDVNIIKQDDRLCSDINNCWLSALNTTIVDRANNYLQPVLSSLALDALEFIDDSESPELLQFSLDLNTGILQLKFNEPVNPDSLMPTSIHLQGGQGIRQYVSLSDTTTTNSSNDLEITLLLSESDVFATKAANFAFSQNDTYIWLESTAFSDIAPRAPNPVKSILPEEAVMVTTYVEDITSPMLVEFGLDLTANTLTLSFDEPVRPATLDISQITLLSDQGQIGELEFVQLTGGRVLQQTSRPGTDIVIFELNNPDLFTIKLNRNLGVNSSDTYISITASTITDMAGNYAEAIPPQLAYPVASNQFVDDSSQASLVSFTLDMNTAQLILTFSDIIAPATLLADRITLQDAPTAAISVMLDSASVTNSSDGFEVVIELAEHTYNDLLANRNLATSKNDTYVTIGADVVKDVGNLDIVPVTDGNALQVSVYIDDETRPYLKNYTLDINTGRLLLSFSETVAVSTLNISYIGLQNEQGVSPSESLQLTGDQPWPAGSRTSSDDGALVVIELGTVDLNLIKLFEDLATTDNNTYLTMIESAVEDIVGNQSLPVDPFEPYAVIEDITSPELDAFNLNMTAGVLYLTFDEVVNSSCLRVEGISLQPASDTFSNRVNLLASSGTKSDSTNGLVVVIDIGRDDLNKIKVNRELATSQDNTYIVVEDFAIKDMSDNSNQPIYYPFGKQVSEYFPDEIAPYLWNFTLDLNTGHMVLTFDEVIEMDSVSIGEITLQNVQNLSEIDTSWTLNPGALPMYSYTVSPDGTNVDISLGLKDLNEIKRLMELATSRDNAYVSFTVDAFQDMNNNSVNSIAEDNAMQALSVTNDTTPPNLEQYDLDMNEGVLTLTFDETVRAQSLVASR